MQLEPPLCVVFNWVIRVYIILVWSTISGFSNRDICFYHYLIIILILHLKVLFIITITIITIIIIIITTITIITSITITIIIVVVVLLLLLLLIYIVNLHVVRPQSCRVIYYFDTPALGRRHQSFGRVSCWLISNVSNVIAESSLHIS